MTDNKLKMNLKVSHVEHGDGEFSLCIQLENTHVSLSTAPYPHCLGNTSDIAIFRINPDEIHLNTVARPTTEEYAWRVPDDQMLKIKESFGERAKVISPFKHEELSTSQAVKEDDVLALLARRPCTLEDIASGLGIHRNEASKYLSALLSEGRVVETRQNRMPYYSASRRGSDET